jgi:hypothetical protein
MLFDLGSGNKIGEIAMITLLMGLTIGFIIGFVTAFIWEHT